MHCIHAHALWLKPNDLHLGQTEIKMLQGKYKVHGSYKVHDCKAYVHLQGQAR